METVLELVEIYSGRLRTGSTASDELENLTAEYAAKLAEKPADPALLYLVALMKVIAGNLEEAKPLVNRLLKVPPTDRKLSWLDTLALEYRIAGDRDSELRLLEAAVEGAAPRNSRRLSETYQRLAMVYAHKGEKEKAQNTLRKMGALRLLRGSRSTGRKRKLQRYMFNMTC